MAEASPRRLNVNLGVLGHIDSGKTSLAKALSTVASTASFDKNPQSRERGITLDLGFSSFAVSLPKHLQSVSESYDELQFTLVDCPGHASLIRTIIGGAQIIDMMMLVVDAIKGVQTQTAECLVIGEILCDKLVVVLNKIDLIPEDKRSKSIEKTIKRLAKTLSTTKFRESPIIPVAAKPGGSDSSSASLGVEKLVEYLTENCPLPKRDPSGSFIFSVDHCFAIRGQGTVMTGTVLNGSVSVNDVVEIPAVKVTKKVKSMQMFHRPIQSAHQGDRVGLCVTQFDPKLLERGLVCSVGALPTIEGGIISVEKVPYFKSEVKTKAKFHISIGHDTVMGKVSFFSAPLDSPIDEFSLEHQYVYQDELYGKSSPKEHEDHEEAISVKQQWAVVEFEKPLVCGKDSLVIGSRLDTDINSNSCRIAFYGRLLRSFVDRANMASVLPQLKVYKMKQKEGIVERMQDSYTVICRSLFKKETNMALFTGLKVNLSTDERGVIEGSFGQSGKVKIRIPSGLSAETQKALASHGKKKGGKESDAKQQGSSSPIRVILNFKRYVYDPEKKMKQS
ncbi:selenocysteine-specific elongation factor-like [Oscarella lobularis]|uniref:selenocysteine-specific elongation factor-like n=1 Tax=Oscarella lobularis TaxID=121494 RepID=UPI0033130BB4